MLYFQDKNNLTVYFADGKMSQWKMSDPEVEKILDLIRKSDWIRIQTLSNPTNAILNAKELSLNENGEINITTQEDEKVEIPVQEEKYTLASLTKLLIDKGATEENLSSVKEFLKKCLDNQYINAVEEIYLFCKEMDFEICDDGDFLAYKEVSGDLTSLYDRKTKHIFGEYVTVDNFCTDRTIACSQGLHFCSKKYLQEMKTGDSKTIVVKVDPRDVVSIPIDHNFQKGRCKRYLPLCFLKEDMTLKDTLKKPEGKKEKIIEEEIIEDVAITKQEETEPIENKQISRKREAYNLYLSGKNTKEISKEMGISIRTAQRYVKDCKDEDSRG